MNLAFEIAKKGLQNSQVGLNVSTNNMVNAANPNYTRQVANVKTSISFLSRYSACWISIVIVKLHNCKNGKKKWIFKENKLLKEVSYQPKSSL